MPWLAALARWTRGEHDEGRGTALTCSAFRRCNRDLLRSAVPGPTFFVHLVAPAAVLAEPTAARMAGRTHVMPVSVLDPQLAPLEPLAIVRRL